MDARRSKSRLQSDPIQARGQEQLLHPGGQSPFAPNELNRRTFGRVIHGSRWLPKGEVGMLGLRAASPAAVVVLTSHESRRPLAAPSPRAQHQNNSDGLSWGDYGVSGFRKQRLLTRQAEGYY